MQECLYTVAKLTFYSIGLPCICTFRCNRYLKVFSENSPCSVYIAIQNGAPDTFKVFTLKTPLYFAKCAPCRCCSLYTGMQVGNLDDYFAFKLPETDQRKNSLHLTGTGQKNHIAQALSNEANVRNDACTC